MSEPRDDRDWEPEENMTIGQSMNEDEYSYADYPGPPMQEQYIPENDPHAFRVFPREPEPQPEIKHKGRTKQFVGGFVSGLRRLPKAVVKSTFYDRKATRKGAPGTEQESGPSHFLPAYDDPGTTVSNPENVHYVQALEMPAEPKPPTELSYADATRPSSQQRVSEQRVSQVRSSRRTSSPAPSASLIGSSPRFRPANEPEVVDPVLASDYRKMEPPIRFAPPEESIREQLSRAKNWFHELKTLPWTSDRVAQDYVPARSSRAHVGKAKPAGSWYTVNKHQDVDLLAGGGLGSARTAPLRLPRSEASASVRSGHRPPLEGRTPASYMTSPALFPSPGASSHGQGQHAISYSYYFAPPQPLYVYQSPMTSPMVHHATDSSSTSMSPEAHQAVPVYMMAGPPPGLIPSPPPAIHAAQHNQANRAASPPPAHIPSRRHSRLSRNSGSNTH